MARNIIFDIDGTLADPKDRLHFLEKKDWNSFYDACLDDVPIHHVIYLLQELKKNHHIIILTGRPERIKDKTLQWLKANNISFDEIYFRKDGDYRPDYEIKEEMLKVLNRPIWFAVDDRKQVVDMFRRNNILCLQCKDGDY